MLLSGLNRVKSRWVQRSNYFFKICNKLSSINLFTNVYGFSRSLLAFGTLITLVFNSADVLYSQELFDSAKAVRSGVDELNLFYLFDYSQLWIPKLISIIILMFVISGYFPFITGIFHWWVSYSFCISASIVDGGDQIASVVTLLLVPVTLLDSRKNHWVNNAVHSKYRNFLAFIFFLFIELQVAVIYFQSSIFKPIRVNEWNDGTAVYYWFNHNMFGAPDWSLGFINYLMDFPILLLLINWSVIIFELVLFGAFFMNRKKRMKFLKYAILFHLSILIVHGLVTFFFAMSAVLILYLYPKNGNAFNLAIFRRFRSKSMKQEA